MTTSFKLTFGDHAGFMGHNLSIAITSNALGRLQMDG